MPGLVFRKDLFCMVVYDPPTPPGRILSPGRFGYRLRLAARTVDPSAIW